MASIAGNAINASAFVEARAGGTVIYVCLAVSPLEAFFAFAAIAIDVVSAGAPMLAGVGFTLVAVHIAVGASPSWFTFTLVSIDVIVACAMHTGAAAALVHFGIAVWIVKTLGTKAGEAVFTIHTGATILAGIGGTFIDLYVAQGTCEARFADAVITIDAIMADAIITGVAGTVVKVYLTVGT